MNTARASLSPSLLHSRGFVLLIASTSGEPPPQITSGPKLLNQKGAGYGPALRTKTATGSSRLDRNPSERIDIAGS